MRNAVTLRARQAGLSLVELMVSITLGLVVLSGVLIVFSNSSAARNEIERTTRQIENGRYASEVLTEDLRMAGFYGELDVSTVAAPGAVPADPCSLTASDWAAWIPIHVQGFDNAGFVSANCALTNQKAGTDALVVRRVRTCTAGSTNCDSVASGKPYLQVSMCSTQTTRYKLGLEGTETFDRETKACSSTVFAEKRDYYVRIYYIATDNGAGVSVPTLKRLELTGSGWTTTPLVEGIEELQFQYGVDNAGSDGVPDTYVANPSTVADWVNVMTVQFHLLARNLETSPNFTDTKTYTLGKDATGTDITVGPRNDGYRRHVYSGLVRIANPAGRRDAP